MVRSFMCNYIGIDEFNRNTGTCWRDGEALLPRHVTYNFGTRREGT